MLAHYPTELCRLVRSNLKDEKWSQIAYFTQYLCSSFVVEEIPIACKNSDLAWVTLGAELFSSVWRSMGFYLSSQEITLAQFGDFPNQRKHLCTYFWKIGVHLKSFKLKYKERLLTVTDYFESLLDCFPNLRFPNLPANMTLSSLMQRLEIIACALLPISVPAKNCIDPVMNDEMNFNYLINKFPSLSITMNNFLETVLEQHRTFSVIDLDNLHKLSDSDIRMAVAQIDCFLTSMQSFYDRTFSEYSAFTDIICPFFMFLNILVATISYKRFHMIQFMNLRNLITTYNFPVTVSVTFDSVVLRNEI
uniref:NR LBD domain-containing protein n=2 Tax=Elaeophora elaphi TaxID=1147741 RepID=A0A0R3RI42_9BILA